MTAKGIKFIANIYKEAKFQAQGAYNALNDGNIKFLDLFKPSNLINNLDMVSKGVNSYAAKEIRLSYNEEINKLKDHYLEVFKDIHSEDMCFSTDLAIEVSNARDAIKLIKQNETPLIGRQQIYARNLKKYNDKNGPSEEYKLKQIEANPEVFAYKALMTDGQDLGLAGNGFKDLVSNWLKSDLFNSGIYPEDLMGNLGNDTHQE